MGCRVEVLRRHCDTTGLQQWCYMLELWMSFLDPYIWFLIKKNRWASDNEERVARVSKSKTKNIYI